MRIRRTLQEKNTEKTLEESMRNQKQKHKDPQIINNVQNDESLEISQTGYGLESVTEGTDYMEGDRKDSTNCGEL